MKVIATINGNIAPKSVLSSGTGLVSAHNMMYNHTVTIFDAETIAGLILEVTGRYPKRKEKISIGPYVISIESLDLKRIKQVKITLPDAPKSV